MLSNIVSNTTTKNSDAIVTGMLFALFSYFGVSVPSRKYKWLVFKLIGTALTSLWKLSSTETSSLTSWLAGAYMLMMLIIRLGSGMNLRLMEIFGIEKHLYDSPFRWTFKLKPFLNSEDVSLILYARFSVLSVITWFVEHYLTHSNTCEHCFPIAERQWNHYRSVEIKFWRRRLCDCLKMYLIIAELLFLEWHVR